MNLYLFNYFYFYKVRQSFDSLHDFIFAFEVLKMQTRVSQSLLTKEEKDAVNLVDSLKMMC